MTVFETARLIVRRFTEGDAEAFFRLNGDPEVTRYIRPAKTRADCDAFLLENIRYAREHAGYGRWAVEERISREVVGSFALIPLGDSGSMQLGYALLPPYWGRGYATELARAGLDYVFEQTDLNEVYAQAEAENGASCRVLLKAGFEQAGRIREDGRDLVRYRFGRQTWNVRGSQ
ncbi:MAG TPA: GNAT family N-acetyltransferase [Chitinophagaceae bacterium]|nr:GNAT family N-acetyltransferase [Chitinophagaceae bacterium]